MANVDHGASGSVIIRGTAEEDQELTASDDVADEDGLGTIGYQCNRDGSTIMYATK